MPRDKIVNNHQGYAFVELNSVEDADYAIRVMNMIRLFGKPIRVNKASKDGKGEEDIGANLFIGNLDPEVDETMLYDTFSAFGSIISAKIMSDSNSGELRGFGFIQYDDFDNADAAISAMNGQYLSNRPIHVSYAYKKDGSKGERHGTQAERMLAAKRKAAKPAVADTPHLRQGPAAMPQQQARPMATQPFMGMAGGMGQMGMAGGMGQMGMPQMGMVAGMMGGMGQMGMGMGMPQMGMGMGQMGMGQMGMGMMAPPPPPQMPPRPPNLPPPPPRMMAPGMPPQPPPPPAHLFMPPPPPSFM